MHPSRKVSFGAVNRALLKDQNRRTERELKIIGRYSKNNPVNLDFLGSMHPEDAAISITTKK